jgi:hypothetical protein
MAMNKNGETLLEPPCMKCGRLNGAHSLRCSTVNLPRVWRLLSLTVRFGA